MSASDVGPRAQNGKLQDSQNFLLALSFPVAPQTDRQECLAEGYGVKAAASPVGRRRRKEIDELREKDRRKAFSHPRR
ncbi:hypothetical protein C0Q70_16551 [Pomacea canaliculata]|uniref:Uncharacterized protein n=1 Tax=Pomacea canaliculata TaxID=400727 RepID=A0A2T7NQ36_POMCA|nr:hypothetical protein C0Q70_16551 [Pomacea canaliculata]